MTTAGSADDRRRIAEASGRALQVLRVSAPLSARVPWVHVTISQESNNDD